MTVTPYMAGVAIVFFVLGYFAHIAWDALCDMLMDAADGARSLFVDVLAIVGAVAIAVGLGYLFTR